MNFSLRYMMVALLLTPTVLVAQHEVFTALLREHVKEGAVDYAAFSQDKRFATYLASLERANPSAMSDTRERLAFWINTYNAFTIKLITDHWPVMSIRDIKKNGSGPWEAVWIRIGKEQYSLDHIEHEIIRKEFDEPRIHAALVCAAVSCPPLRSEAYTGKRLDAQLQDNMLRFLQDTTKNRYDMKTNTLFLSEVFNWFGGDFAKQHGDAASYVLAMLNITPPSKPKVVYLPYDWTLNAHP